ncbi:hypothetical protein SHPE106448_16800 [Shewanella pealeana]
MLGRFAARAGFALLGKAQARPTTATAFPAFPRFCFSSNLGSILAFPISSVSAAFRK